MQVWAFPFSLAATRGITRVAFPSNKHNARRERNSYCYLFLQVLRCFTSLGSLHAGVTPRIHAQRMWVSPFGYLRIKGYIPPPRSFSQVSRVLLSRPRPRHPPCTLMSPVRRPEYHNHPSAFLQQVTFEFPQHHCCKFSFCTSTPVTYWISIMRIRMSKNIRALETKEPPEAVLWRYAQKWPVTAGPLLVVGDSFGSYTRERQYRRAARERQARQNAKPPLRAVLLKTKVLVPDF
jgi:hypothetical protein